MHLNRYSLCFALIISAALTSADENAPMVDAKPAKPPADAVTLEYKFQVGEEVRYQVQSESTMVTQGSSLVETVRDRAHEMKHFRVASVDDKGNATIICTLDHVRMWAKFNDDAPMQFASDWPLNRVPSKYRTVWNSVGKPLARMKVSAKGKLLDVHLLEHQQYKGATKGPLAAPESSLDYQQVNFLVEFPDKPVAVGGTWSQRITLTVNVDAKLTRNVNLLRTYKLIEVKDGIARIKMVTSVLGKTYDPRVKVQLLQREPRGEITFDIARGKLMSRKTVHEKQLLEPFGSKSAVSVKATRNELLIVKGKDARRS